MSEHTLNNVIYALLHKDAKHLRQHMHNICDMMIENADVDAIKLVMEYIGDGYAIEVLATK